MTLSWPPLPTPMALWKGNEILENCGDHPHTHESDRKQCKNHRNISILSVPKKVYVKFLEKRCRETNEPKLKDSQDVISRQIFILQQIFERSWENAKDVCCYFVDLEKA